MKKYLILLIPFILGIALIVIGYIAPSAKSLDPFADLIALLTALPVIIAIYFAEDDYRKWRENNGKISKDFIRKAIVGLNILIIAVMVILAVITTQHNVGNPLLGEFLYSVIGISVLTIGFSKEKISFFSWVGTIFSIAGICRFSFIVYTLIHMK